MIFEVSSIFLAVAVTSALSGVLGMGGGIILMGVLTSLLPSSAAMILHGISQVAANGSRAILHYKYIKWKIIPYYIIGAAISVAFLSAFSFIPSKWVIFLLMGLMPFGALLLKGKLSLNIESPIQAVICAILVNLMQLSCGVSGPVLDIFFVRTKLSRHEVVSTKAITQTFGHALKLVYYGGIVNSTNDVSLPFYVPFVVCAIAIVGTWMGGKWLNRASNEWFQTWSQRIIQVIGVVYLFKGAMEFYKVFVAA